MEDTDFVWMVYGSASSQDCDVFALIESADRFQGKPHLASNLCAFIQNLLVQSGSLHSAGDKKISVNVGVLDKQTHKLSWAFKGAADETNNSIFYTYHLHAHLQKHPLMIKGVLPIDVKARTMRGLRLIISAITRTNYRVETKRALKENTVLSKVKVLRGIQIETMTLAQNVKMTLVEILKTIAFKVGHTLALHLFPEKELVTKEDIAQVFPDLATFLFRQGNATTVDLQKLDILIQMLLDEVDKMIQACPDYAHEKEFVNMCD